MVLIFLFNQQILVKFLEENQSQQKQVLVLQKHKESFSGRLPISFRDFCFGEIERKAWLVEKKKPSHKPKTAYLGSFYTWPTAG